MVAKASSDLDLRLTCAFTPHERASGERRKDRIMNEGCAASQLADQSGSCRSTKDRRLKPTAGTCYVRRR